MTRFATAILLAGVSATVVAAPALRNADARLLYVSGDPGEYQIYSVKPDGTGSEKLTSDAGNHLFPASSPDGKKIAFSIEKDGQQQLYVMDADGKNAKELTKDGQINRGAAWSPDGKKIAFTRWTGVSYNVFVIDAALHVTNGGFNPVLTIMALAFRCGAKVAATLS